MSDRMWEGTIGHARTCQFGERIYVHRKQQSAVFLNNICEVIAVAINGVKLLQPQELNRSQKVSPSFEIASVDIIYVSLLVLIHQSHVQAYVQEMVQEAYQNWDRLEESDRMLCNTVLLQST